MLASKFLYDAGTYAYTSNVEVCGDLCQNGTRYQVVVRVVKCQDESKKKVVRIGRMYPSNAGVGISFAIHPIECSRLEPVGICQHSMDSTGTTLCSRYQLLMGGITWILHFQAIVRTLKFQIYFRSTVDVIPLPTGICYSNSAF